MYVCTTLVLVPSTTATAVAVTLSVPQLPVVDTEHCVNTTIRESTERESTEREREREREGERERGRQREQERARENEEGGGAAERRERAENLLQLCT